MQRTKTRTLKISVDSESLSVPDINSLEQWENEGGSSLSQSVLWKSTAPLHKGEIFKVVSVDIQYGDGNLFYLAEVVMLSKPR